MTNHEQIRLTAIHEAGHIVAATLMQFSVEHVSVEMNGDGKLKINYGDLTPVASPLMTLDLGLGFDEFLKKLNQQALTELGKRLCFVLLAGGAAEFTCGGGKIEGENAIIEISGPDKTRAEAISAFLGIDLQKTMESVYMCMQDKQFVSGVQEISNAIRNSNELALNCSAIRLALDTSGFTAFLEQS